VPNELAVKEFASKKMAAGLCGVLIGAWGVHKFILGDSKQGIIRIICTCTCIGAPIMSIIGLVEGIMYLTKSDEEFYQLYAVEKKAWF
jgi:TM2 domain-containing membrane protein YozV